MMGAGILLRVETHVFLYSGIGPLLKEVGMTGPAQDQFLSELLLGLVLTMNAFVSFYGSTDRSPWMTGGLLIPACTLVILVIPILARMLPAATIFCQKYYGDAAFTSTCAFVSTALPFVTLWRVRF